MKGGVYLDGRSRWYPPGYLHHVCGEAHQVVSGRPPQRAGARGTRSNRGTSTRSHTRSDTTGRYGVARQCGAIAAAQLRLTLPGARPGYHGNRRQRPPPPAAVALTPADPLVRNHCPGHLHTHGARKKLIRELWLRKKRNIRPVLASV